MTNNNSSSSSDQTKVSKPKYFEYCVDLGSSIWDIHALAQGAESLITEFGPDSSNELISARSLVRQLQSSIEALARTVDSSSFDYVLKSETNKAPRIESEVSA